MLPFLPHWVVPGFLRACTAVCVLENRFPSPSTSRPPRLKYLLAVILVLSEGSALSSGTKRIHDHKNFLLVRDPQNISALSETLGWVIDNPQDALCVGMRGALLFESTFDLVNTKVYEPLDRLAEVIERKKADMSLQTLQRKSSLNCTQTVPSEQLCS